MAGYKILNVSSVENYGHTFNLVNFNQARSQKFAIGGMCLRIWGQSLQPLETGALEAKPPAAGGTGSGAGASSARKFCIFLKKQLNMIKNNAFKT